MCLGERFFVKISCRARIISEIRQLESFPYPTTFPTLISFSPRSLVLSSSTPSTQAGGWLGFARSDLKQEATTAFTAGEFQHAADLYLHFVFRAYLTVHKNVPTFAKVSAEVRTSSICSNSEHSLSLPTYAAAKLKKKHWQF